MQINQSNFKTEVLDSDKTVLVDFYADWCGPCQMFSPTIDEVASEHPEIKVCKLNVDDNQDIASEYGIMSIPSLIVFKNGKAVNQSVGVISKEKILELMN